ncbi:MAG: type II toxin-antitoxin system Phd/YefM family antitoxin [Rhodocyclaceae bacterium]|nr:type II toxin-antitoxin system Phd/YefM family antitoxin [Rhodocyclaceae bacterium]
MAHPILAPVAASITELKRDPMGTVASGEGGPVAILNRNEPAFYCVPAPAFEALLEKIEDLELNALADSRAGQDEIPVTLDAL